MSRKERYKKILDYFSRKLPHAETELSYRSPYELLVAVMLSAQCTDKRVNMVTANLFKRYSTVDDFAEVDLRELQTLIKSTGFFRAKARNIKGLANVIINDFGGKVPKTLEELVTLPGVGRKTANVVLGHAFQTPGITVDTHFGRLSRRFGWTKEKDPVKVEFAVMELIPRREWTNLSQRMIWHGRRICFARNPACGACPLAKNCPSYGIGEMDKVKAKTLIKSEVDFR